MNNPANPSSETAGRRKHRFVLFFSVFVLISGGAAFSFELIEFIYTIGSGQAVDFAILPVATYLTVAAGFLCLLVRAYLTGQFKDLEGPKHRMLELEEKWDRAEREAHDQGES